MPRTRAPNEPVVSSAPRETCALINCSVSSTSTGTKRSATSVISPNSSTGSRSAFSGRSSSTTPSASATGVVVSVSVIEPR